MTYDGYRNPDVNDWWRDGDDYEDCPEKKCPTCKKVYGPSQYDCCGKKLIPS